MRPSPFVKIEQELKNRTAFFFSGCRTIVFSTRSYCCVCKAAVKVTPKKRRKKQTNKQQQKKQRRKVHLGVKIKRAKTGLRR